ncbi:MAG: tRNA nucleotidyltransferase [Clostridiales bacterium]|jgi:tRNA nucleotidyltransferase (CCA-adding enzyme)|nr:tRNA nucleotidyltransferase [Clostridiales bacterium]
MNLKRDVKIPEQVAFIFRVLNCAGFEAFIVGGCVRDSIMGRKPGDWDIATNAMPHEVKFLFSKTIDTGIKHGTVTVVIQGSNFEVTTYRVDGEYRDSRHPEFVEYTSSLKEDLSRRDFTVNAIAYHPEKGFIDPFNGASDIEAGIIRAVGSPSERFREDALRMLRALRFSAQLGFEIEKQTLEGISHNKELILNISSERIRDELSKILISDHTDKFYLLKETGLLKLLIPELDACYEIEQNNPYHIYNVGEHSLKAVSAILNEPSLRWTMLLHDVGKTLTKTTDAQGIDHFYEHHEKSMQLAAEILKGLKFDNKTIDKVSRLIKHHDRQIDLSIKSVRKTLNIVGNDIFEDLLLVREADVKAQNPELAVKRLEQLDIIKNLYDEIKCKNDCTDIKDLAVNGDDLISMGIPQGKEIKEVLEKLLEVVLEDPDLNRRDILEDRIKEIISIKN